MPIGSFLIEIDSKSKSSIIDQYFEDDEQQITIDDNLILQLKIGLSDNRLYTLLKPDNSIVCFLTDFKEFNRP